MKNQPKHKSSNGFTLIELLVVIAIIATLAAATFAIGPRMMDKARKVSAQAAATSIATAVDQFYTEYSALPDPGSSSETSALDTTTATGTTLLKILSGLEQSANPQNPRKIRFLTVKEGKGSKDGIIYSADGRSIEGMFDPWGQPYFIHLDDDQNDGYDEKLKFTPGGLPSVTLNGRRVAVYSLGVADPADAKVSTLVKTW